MQIIPHRHRPTSRPEPRRQAVLALLAAALLPASAALAASPADDYPNRPVTLILPQPPGGAADRLMRTIGAGLEKRWGQPVIVISRPGGGAVVGTLATARSAPDGYTLGLTSSSLSINAALERELPYDGMRDLAPLYRLGYYTLGLVADKDFPADSIAELIEQAKASPEGLMYGSNGAYTAAHVAGETFNKMADVKMQHVPYNGAANLYNDIRGGNLRLGYSVLSSAVPFIQKGDMKVLGVTSRDRSPLYPDWPTIAETIPDYEILSWAGFVVPTGTPEDVQRKIAADLEEVLATPEVQESMVIMGFELSTQGPEDFSRFVRAETERYRAISAEIGASLQ